MLTRARETLRLAAHVLPFTRYPYDGQLVDCPVCGEQGFTPLCGLDRRLKRLPTVMCDRCGLLYTNPLPSEAELKRYYAKYYRLDYQFAVLRPSRRHVAKRSRRARYYMRAIEDFLPRGARTLDAGAGAGEFVAQMLASGFDSYGFDVGEAYGSYARKIVGDRFRICDWEDARYAPEFDLVTSFHVLEHLRAPMQALQAMASWIRPSGKIYVAVPDMAKVVRGRGLAGFHFAHVVGFNHFNLRLAAARAGLRPCRSIRPTALIFERGAAEEESWLAAEALALARASCLETRWRHAYFRHQLGKLGIRLAAPATAAAPPGI